MCDHVSSLCEQNTKRPVLPKVLALLATTTLLTSCDDFNAAPVNFSQADIVAVGDVRTLEVQGRTFTSLPASPPAVDARQAALGRDLFWDPILSGNRDVACATCHLPEHGYTDGQPRAIGVGGSGRGSMRVVGHTDRVRRNTQTVLNAVWNGIDSLGAFDPNTAPMFWDNRTRTLEAQALEPIRSREEMRGGAFTESQIEAEVVARLNGIAAYTQAFNDAFGSTPITIDQVATALANFQRTLVANNTPFDRWMRGEPNAMTPNQLSGMVEFAASGCADCHSGPLFSDFQLRVLGTPEGAGLLQPDTGDGNFAFRTPTLRQLDATGPFFHAGQFATLEAAVNFYDESAVTDNPNVPSTSLDPLLQNVPEMEDGRGAILVDFLRALNDDSFDKTEPATVPSGLSPGGFL
ncbi:MAG: cytochrome-c peroxidase [Pseudomonadota bacterium]